VIKILTVIGARPQFIKAGPVSAALAGLATEVVVNTDQHYDPEMSDVFFRELGLRPADYSLDVGSGSHGVQTGEMLKRLEPVMLEEKPDVVMVYGDTNSTLAGALTAAKLRLPIAHVEAGLRSFNRAMPEEVNRIVTDHLSTLLFTPAASSENQLRQEGITRGVHVTGDVMYDAVLHYAPLAAQASRYPQSLGLEPKRFYLCTVHRAENTDDPVKLRSIIEALSAVPLPVILPLHPRTRKKLNEITVPATRNVHILEPVGYLDMLQLLQSSATVITDSGGLQKEAYYLGVPCVTLRLETEWTETVDAGWNELVGCDEKLILAAVAAAQQPPQSRPKLYGDGQAAPRIARILTQYAADSADERRAAEALTL